jgi:hypothetical protein
LGDFHRFDLLEEFGDFSNFGELDTEGLELNSQKSGYICEDIFDRKGSLT